MGLVRVLIIYNYSGSAPLADSGGGGGGGGGGDGGSYDYRSGGGGSYDYRSGRGGRAHKRHVIAERALFFLFFYCLFFLVHFF
eukprot:SAG11_NODE_325_length_10712_cov_15.479883_5_plen_83_part_00